MLKLAALVLCGVSLFGQATSQRALTVAQRADIAKHLAPFKGQTFRIAHVAGTAEFSATLSKLLTASIPGWVQQNSHVITTDRSRGIVVEVITDDAPIPFAWRSAANALVTALKENGIPATLEVIEHAPRTPAIFINVAPVQ